jgi:hypothetical protein
MPSQSIYIDADMLIFYFDKHSNKQGDKDDDMGRIARDTLKKVMAALHNSEIHAKIPQVVLGELFLFFCKENQDAYDPLKFIELIKKMGNEHPCANTKTLKLCQELLNDHSIKPNDAVLVAHALLDKSTKWLLTTDQTLITNLTIKNKMDALKNKFTIDSRFHV